MQFVAKMHDRLHFVSVMGSHTQRLVRLQGVLNTMETVRKRLKPGVAWPDMHRLADRCNLETLAAEVHFHAQLEQPQPYLWWMRTLDGMHQPFDEELV
jgi:hypothetical protein